MAHQAPRGWGKLTILFFFPLWWETFSIYLVIYLFWLHCSSMQSRDQTQAPAVKVLSPNHQQQGINSQAALSLIHWIWGRNDFQFPTLFIHVVEEAWQLMRQRIGSVFRFVKQTFAVTSAVGSRKIQVVRAVDEMWLSESPKESEGHSVILMVAKIVLLLFCFYSILFIQTWVQKLKFYFLVYTCLWNHWLHIQHACMHECSVTAVASNSLWPHGL